MNRALKTEPQDDEPQPAGLDPAAGGREGRRNRGLRRLEAVPRPVHRSSAILRVWGWPLALGALTIFGLLSALLGERGIWWVLSWIALSIPLAVIVLFVSRAFLRLGRARSPTKRP